MTTVEGQIQIKIEQLLNKINESIPVHWDELYVNIEMNNDGGTVYFFFKEQMKYNFIIVSLYLKNLRFLIKFLERTIESSLILVENFGFFLKRMV